MFIYVVRTKIRLKILYSMTFCLLEILHKMSNNFDVNQNLTFFVAKKQARLSSDKYQKRMCFPNKQSYVIHRIFLILQDRSIRHGTILDTSRFVLDNHNYMWALICSFQTV